MAEEKTKTHQQIGQEQELFFTHESAPGSVYWLPRGMIIFKELEKYIRELTENSGYQETSTPILVKSQIFKQSGHWDKFGTKNESQKVYGSHEMYNLALYEDEEIEEHKRAIEQKIPHPDLLSTVFPSGERVHMPVVNYSLKPMNCPESTVLYRFRSRSYRDLPMKLSEIGRLFRREKSGEIGGLLRVRQLTMDDAHIYATEDQILEEVSNILDMMTDFYKKFGFEYEFRFATRPEQRAGTDPMWDEAEKTLDKVLKQKKIKAGAKKGDGAFYGPKIDLHIKDSLGREWQLATVQLDFHQPEAFKLEYTDKKGEKQRPVMIHRAIFGSFERFIGILTEHFQGKFPVWLSPVQAIVIPITEKQNEYAGSVYQQLIEHGIRVELDSRNETLQSKIRDHTLQKVPYLCIIGGREVESSSISVRTREGKDLGQVKLSEFVKRIKEDIAKKT